MKLGTAERTVLKPISLIKQVVTVLGEQDPKQITIPHSNDPKRVSFTVTRPGIVYALVKGEQSGDELETVITIETYMVDTSFLPIALTVLVALAIAFVVMIKPSTLLDWLPMIAFLGLMIRMSGPYLTARRDERRLMATIDDMFVGMSDKRVEGADK